MTGYLRYPTIHGDSVVFGCEDDLWWVAATGGTASRLTAGTSEAGRARLSPDGTQIAYVGADDGPTEVYVLPTHGGSARRLTFQAARCSVVGWHPVTGEILYASTAEQPGDFGSRLFAVDPAGGSTRLLVRGPGSTVCFGPGGAVVLGRSLADPARRKRYRGGAAGEFWIDPDGSGRFTRLDAGAGNLADPCWIGDRLYFLSDRDGTGNVHSVRPDGTDRRQHTDHRDFYARSLSGDGRRLVYHAGAQLHLFDPATGHREALAVQTISSHSQLARRIVAAEDYLDSARLTPDGAALALVARGRAFSLAPWSGPVRQHGSPDSVRHRLLGALADERGFVAVAADEAPDERLVVFAADDSGERLRVELGGLGYVTELLAAPRGGRVAFTTNRQQLWTVDTDEADPVPRLLDSTPHERLEDLAWSPDGRWVAYTHPDSARTSSIRVADVASGRTVPVTRPVLRDSRPAFDPDGRYLYFLGQRDLTPEIDQVQADVGFPYGARPFLITLRAGQASPFVQPVGDVDDDGPPCVDIDFTDIERRVVAFPVPEGRYAGVLGLHGRALLLGVPVLAPDPLRPAGTPPEPEGTITVLDLTTGEVETDYLEDVDEISADAAGRTLLVRSGRRLRVLAANTTPDEAAEHDTRWAVPGRRTGWVALDRVQVAVRPALEWKQMFREAWRLQREAFWDPGMSGIDWDAMYTRYEPLADRVASRAELSDLLWELQGELGTSHAYERAGDHRRPLGHEQGFLGVDWARPEAEDPRWCIENILLGDPWDEAATSPCNRPGVDIRPGDELVAVNGTPLGRPGPGELLVGQAGHDVRLTLRRAGDELRHVDVRPVADESRARYLDWVAANRHYVRTFSNGRLGYLHVPDMFARGYADFIRGFLTELDRAGLVVDVRGNGGGHVSPLLLDRLTRRRGGQEHGRHSGALPYPLEAPCGPMVLLVDEQTGSDAELFAHQFRALGLGRIVGRRTWGGTIATWPRHQLVDGTVTTQPEFSYVLGAEGHGLPTRRLENHGVEPDLTVDVVPMGGRPGVDAQLAAAVAYLDPGPSPVHAPRPAPVTAGLPDPGQTRTRARAAAAIRAGRRSESRAVAPGPLRAVPPWGSS